jgi:hypothetical protein
MKRRAVLRAILAAPGFTLTPLEPAPLRMLPLAPTLTSVRVNPNGRSITITYSGTLDP